MEEQLLMNAGATTTGVAIILLLYRFFKSVKGKKLVSSCCGRKMEVGFDVAAMTPVSVPNPLPQMTIRTHEQSEQKGVPSQPSCPASLV